VIVIKGNQYIALTVSDEAIFHEHFYHDAIGGPKPAGKLPTSDISSKSPREESLDDYSPPESPKPQKLSQELAGLETSLGDAWKPPGNK